jgi:hypothetical protein
VHPAIPAAAWQRGERMLSDSAARSIGTRRNSASPSPSQSLELRESP